MKVLGGEKRLKELQDADRHVCPACDGSGIGDVIDGVDWFPPCNECNGCGDDEAWRRYLDELFYD